MDVFVSHGQSSLTTAERLGDLGWGPYREVAPAHVLLVEDVGKSSDLVFLVVKKSLECHDVGSHQVTHGVFGGVEGCGLREDDPPAVLVSLRQHKDVASRHQVRYGRVLRDKTQSEKIFLKCTNLPGSPSSGTRRDTGLSSSDICPGWCRTPARQISASSGNGE